MLEKDNGAFFLSLINDPQTYVNISYLNVNTEKWQISGIQCGRTKFIFYTTSLR